MGGQKGGSVKHIKGDYRFLEVIATYCLLLVQETKRCQLQDYTAIISTGITHNYPCWGCGLTFRRIVLQVKTRCAVSCACWPAGTK